MGFFRVSKAKNADYSKLGKLSFLLGRPELTTACGRINHPEFLTKMLPVKMALENNSVNIRLNEQSINGAAKLLSAMENPKRLVVLKILIEEEMSVGQLAERVGLSQSALSQHLSKLRSAELVQTRRDAQTIYYFSPSQAVRQLLRTLDEIFVEKPPVLLGAAVKIF